MNNSWLHNNLEFEIPRLLLETITDSKPQVKQPFSTLRNQALKKVEAYIAEFSHEPPTISKICKIAGVRIRTLEYAFLEQYGVTPKIYLEAYRLNAVRKELQKNDPSETKIADIANRWGLWHMGKFAADYRRKFGDLPSETSGEYSIY